MQLVSIDDVPGGSPGVRLVSGGYVHLARAACAGTLEAWLPRDMLGLLDGGPEALDLVRGIVARAVAGDSPDAVLPPTTRLLAPVPWPRMMIAAGLAYRSHLAEMSGTPAPAQPTAFMKAPASIHAPGATLRLPPQADSQVDYEGELACVFGRTCHQVSEQDALSYLAGYTAANDLSARDWVKPVWAATAPWQARQTWEVNIMGKQLPGFTPLGPVLTTIDEIADPATLRLQTRLNGTTMQDAPVSDLIFPVAEVIAYLSRWYTFQPGDVLLTGTPAGVGVSRTPPVFLAPGDVVEVEIDRIGTLATRIALA